MVSKKPITILIVDDNSSFVLPIVRCFSDYPEFRLDVLVGSTAKPNYFKYSRYIRTVYQEVPFTDDNFGKIIRKYIGKSSADLIIPVKEAISKLICRHRQELEKIVKVHPLSDVDTIETVNDKWRLNNWLKSNNFPYALVEKFSNDPDMNRILDLFTFPVLLKPSVSLGGKGIKLIEKKENLTNFQFKNDDHRNSFIIQEYIDGYDIGINIFAINGKIKYHTIQKELIPGKLAYSRGVEFVKSPVLYKIASEIVGRLKYSGVANLDFRYDSKRDTFILLDFNARYWSTLHGSRFMGVNFPLLATEYSLGIQSGITEYSDGTFYCTNEAVRTFIRNLYSRKKYPINLRHTKLSVMIMDPGPEIFQTGDLLLEIIRRSYRRILKLVA
jgi:predicted ATP-grasp superfamily ATP-dependent carboligase